MDQPEQQMPVEAALARARWTADEIGTMTPEETREHLGAAVLLALALDGFYGLTELGAEPDWLPQYHQGVLTTAVHAMNANGTSGETAVTNAVELARPWPQDFRRYIEMAREVAGRGLDPAAAQTMGNRLASLVELLGIALDVHHMGAWPVLTLEDAYLPRPPVQYVIDALFPLPSLSIVYGAPGSYKTLLMADAGLCVAGGRPWLEAMPGGEPVAARRTLQQPVFYLDFDNGERQMHEKVEALARSRNLPADTPFYYTSMPLPWLDARTEATMDLLADYVLRLGARFVVIDNLGTVSGGIEENSSGMIQVIAAFRQLAERTGAAVVLIHHQRKTSGIKARAGESLRGHSSIEAALDLALLVDRKERATDVEISSTKTRGVDVWPFGAMFTYEHRPGTVDLETARFYGCPAGDEDSDAAIRATILALATNEPGIQKTNLEKHASEIHAGTPRKRIRENLDAAIKNGNLRFEIGPNNAKQLYLALG